MVDIPLRKPDIPKNERFSGALFPLIAVVDNQDIILAKRG
jgi:hypothetical protein